MLRMIMIVSAAALGFFASWAVSGCAWSPERSASIADASVLGGSIGAAPAIFDAHPHGDGVFAGLLEEPSP